MKNVETGQFEGFTLVELLVVVLIVGILAAVALPQYEKAVAKSRAASILPLAKTVLNAQEAYFMAHGQYASSWDDLDVEMPVPLSTTPVKIPGVGIQDVKVYKNFQVGTQFNGDKIVGMDFILINSGVYNGAGFRVGVYKLANIKPGVLYCWEPAGGVGGVVERLCQDVLHLGAPLYKGWYGNWWIM